MGFTKEGHDLGLVRRLRKDYLGVAGGNELGFLLAGDIEDEEGLLETPPG
ncbi:MAG: hypothetical protein WCQ50_13600 [Spirochaetota bacterium]